jgi:hypothetical protein
MGFTSSKTREDLVIDPNFVYLAAIITLSGLLVYAVNTFRGKTKPNRVTWILWTVIPLITFFAQLSKDVGISSIFALVYGLGPLLVLIASFTNKHAYWKLTAFDYICGFISILAVVFWIITGDGTTAIILSIVADFAAGLPTLRKSFYDPKSENSAAYIAGIASGGITLLTIQTWNIASFSFPLYILLDSALIFLTIKVFSRFSPVKYRQ